MEFYHFIVNFFRDGGFFLYPLAAIFVVGVAIAIERFIYLTIETTQQPPPVGPGGAADQRRQLQAGGRDHLEVEGCDRDGAELRHRAARQRAPARRRREGDGREPARDHPAHGEAHALPLGARQHRHAHRSARHGHRPDRGVRLDRAGEPGGEGQPARRQHLGRHEQHRLGSVRARSRCCSRTCSSKRRPPS